MIVKLPTEQTNNINLAVLRRLAVEKTHGKDMTGAGITRITDKTPTQLLTMDERPLMDELLKIATSGEIQKEVDLVKTGFLGEYLVAHFFDTEGIAYEYDSATTLTTGLPYDFKVNDKTYDVKCMVLGGNKKRALVNLKQFEDAASGKKPVDYYIFVSLASTNPVIGNISKPYSLAEVDDWKVFGGGSSLAKAEFLKNMHGINRAYFMAE